MAQTQLKAQIIIQVTVPQGAPLGPVIQQVQALQQSIGATGPLTINLSQNVRQFQMTARRMLLDLRMFSFAVRTLRRELGDTNPVIEAVSRGLLVVSAVGTGVVSLYDMWKMLSVPLRSATLSLSGAVGALSAGLKSLGGILLTLAPVLILVGGIIAGWYIGEHVSGIRDIQKAIKGWKEEIEELEDALKDLRYEQSKVSEEMQYYQYWLDNIEYAEKKMGYATEEMARDQEYIQQQIAATERTMSGYRWEITRTGNQMTGLERATEDAEESIKQIRTGAMDILKGFFGTLANPLKWSTIPQQIGSFMGGLGGNQTAQNIRGGGGNTTVSINFPNANFNNVGDVERALMRGGLLVGEELEYSRRGIR